MTDPNAVSDTVDIGNYRYGHPSSAPEWFQAVRSSRSPGPVSRQTSRSRTASMSPSRPPTYSATREEHTPATSRYPADLTAMGSPIAPITDDDSDLRLHEVLQHINRQGSRSASVGGGSRARAPAAPPTGSPRQHAVTESQDNLVQHSPFGESAGGATVAPGSTTGGDGDYPTSYSSALMQALSRLEGTEVANTRQIRWTGDASPGGGTIDMYEEAMRAKLAKQQWIALEKARKEVLESARLRRDCPFKPVVSPYAARMKRPASLRPENRVAAEVLRRKLLVAAKHQEVVERELAECTFRPLTLQSAKMIPGAPQSSRENVFEDLYEEAVERQEFVHELRPRLVEAWEKQQRTSCGPLPQEEVAQVVDRLFSRAAVLQTKAGQEVAPKASLAPEVLPRSAEIVAQKIAAGERDVDVVRRLYEAKEKSKLEKQLKRELEEEAQRVTRAKITLEAEKERRELQREYYRSVVAAKFRELAQHIAQMSSRMYRSNAPQRVTDLARGSLSLLSFEEAEELLQIVEHCGKERLLEGEFVLLVEQYGAERGLKPFEVALLHRPPPSSARRAEKRAGSCTAPDVSDSPPQLPTVKREKPDPEVLAQVRTRRREKIEQWKIERQRQVDIRDGVIPEGENVAFQPALRRLIPYECRPDVHVPVKTTKAETLRRAYICSRTPSASASLPTTSPLALLGRLGTSRELFERDAASTTVLQSTPDRAFRRETALNRRCSSQSAGSTQRDPMAAAATPFSWAPKQNAGSTTKTVWLPPPLSSQELRAEVDREEQLQALQAEDPALTKPSRAPPQLPSDAVARQFPSSHSARSNSGTEAKGLSLAKSQRLSSLAHNAPGERALLGRELLLQQLREHQRRRGKR